MDGEDGEDGDGEDGDGEDEEDNEPYNYYYNKPDEERDAPPFVKFPVTILYSDN